MTVTVKISEPKGQLLELLDKIEAGEDIIIARGDVPIARLSQIPQRSAVAELIRTIKSQRDLRSATSRDEIKTWRNEGRP
ncbi:type II toxin-antitoxin system Phd/YefM family antitoxin [Rhizobium wuzhouense]|uniref:Type II toxin-antitoxin system prevent-host-death family antitoxin n=1 Tax=Rhizobium wuzhouense TaxID=1986026 RepID=A0ABX5NPQ0_9HYPH|nr:type II toxin-antitoxin system prevent-host-death family antitoxin [Rhizobium wuzhouense]PYB71727.1 type II toxin-antitoxin system prevent-host-death family antitoxin [Rhizobium wuzhouense]